MIRNPLIVVSLALATVLADAPGCLAAVPPASDVIAAAEAFLTEELRSLGPAASFRIDTAADTHRRRCDQPEVFLPAGSRLWGRSRLGVRCRLPTSWTVYLGIQVKISGRYVVSTRKIERGQIIGESDLALAEGELTALPDTPLTDIAHVIGRRSSASLAAGQALRRSQLLSVPIIRQGDRVRIVVRGGAFAASTEGSALTTAGEGEAVRARTVSGRTVSGIARAGGEVELPP